VPEGPVLVVGATGPHRPSDRRAPDRARDCGAGTGPGSGKGGEVLPPEVSQYVGDVRRRETLTEPVAGARAMIIATCSSPECGNEAETVDYIGTCNLIEQAAAADFEQVLFISSIHATHPEHYQDVEPTSLGWKARAEEAIRSSRVPYCIVRPGWLTDGAGGEPLAVSQGDTAEGRISRTDLADACMQLLLRAEATGKTFEVVASPVGLSSGLASAVAALAPDAEGSARS
jgi:uncharacterized protein YbjT (DUF2867 family)